MTFRSFFRRILGGANTSTGSQNALTQDDDNFLRIDLDKASPDTERTFRLPNAIVHQRGKVATAITDDGVQHRLDGATGELTTTIPVLRRIEIASLVQVESHMINRVHQTTSHVVRFVGGGTFTVVYDDMGGPVEMESFNLDKTSDANGVITLIGTHVAGTRVRPSSRTL